MTFVLKSVVPWGRSFEEYISMFSLTEEDLRSSILGCGDGPAGFNARMNGMGHRVVSCDPLYQLPYNQIDRAILAARDEVMQQVRENLQNFTWKTLRSPAELEEVRMKAMREFLADFTGGLTEGRYLPAMLPELPFRNRQFDLCLCSHFLFLYNSLGPDFHIRSIREMARVACEVRIYPVVNTDGKRADYFDDVMDRIHASGLSARTELVRYDFLRNGHEMLRIVHPASD
nr:hypothetical protein [uncultured Methanoregula sp.]